MKLSEKLCVSILAFTLLGSLNEPTALATANPPHEYLQNIQMVLQEYPTPDCQLPFDAYLTTFDDDVISQSIAKGDNQTLSKIMGVLVLLDKEWNLIQENCVNHLPSRSADFMDEQLVPIRVWILEKQFDLIQKINLRLQVLATLEPDLFLAPPVSDLERSRYVQSYLNPKYEKQGHVFELSSFLVNNPKFSLVKHRASIEFMFRQKHPTKSDPLSAQQLFKFLEFIETYAQGSQRLDALKNMGVRSAVSRMIRNSYHKAFNANWHLPGYPLLDRTLTNLLFPLSALKRKSQPEQSLYRLEEMTPSLYEALLSFLTMATQDEENYQIATLALGALEENPEAIEFPHYPVIGRFLKSYTEAFKNKESSSLFRFARNVLSLQNEVLRVRKTVENELQAMNELRSEENRIISQDVVTEEDAKHLAFIAQTIAEKKSHYSLEYKKQISKELHLKGAKNQFLQIDLAPLIYMNNSPRASTL